MIILGASGVLCGYPLDTVKVKIQTQTATHKKLYKGTLDCLLQTAGKDGVKSLYKGMSSPLLGIAGINAVSVAAFERTFGLLPNQDSLSSVAIAGSAAGLIQSVLVCPMELLKTQMQMSRKTGLFDAFQSIYNQAGLRGLYRGLGVTMMREVPALGMYFAYFEGLLR